MKEFAEMTLQEQYEYLARLSPCGADGDSMYVYHTEDDELSYLLPIEVHDLIDALRDYVKRDIQFEERLAAKVKERA